MYSMEPALILILHAIRLWSVIDKARRGANEINRQAWIAPPEISHQTVIRCPVRTTGVWSSKV